MGKGLGWAGQQTREETDLGPGGGLVSSGHVGLSPGSLFLVRESQRNPQGFVLSLCHVQKVKHYLILPVSIPASCRRNAQQPILPTLPPGCLGSPLFPCCCTSNGDLSLGPGGRSSRPSPLPDFPPAVATPQSEEEGRLYFSMDDGQTRFTDLLQLVEFHQLNRGILPCLLRYCCTRVAL